MAELNAAQKKRLKTAIKFLRDEKKPLVKQDVVWLLDHVKPVFMNQPMLIEVEAPVSICGDVHGQFVDLLRLFKQHGWPPRTQYLFLGDYVDRGPQNVETISMMFALKARYPDRFHILRGNHETLAVNRVYGFYDDVKKFYGLQEPKVYKMFNDVFDWMPLSGLVSDRILCMHGGISPGLTNFDQIRNIQRPLPEVPDQGIVADLLWADPDKAVKGFAPSSRGISYLFGPDTVIDICNTLGLDLIARAHQVVHEGYEFFASDRLITLFTAPDYCNQFTNSGGVLVVNENLNCIIKKLASRTEKVPTDTSVREKSAKSGPDASSSQKSMSQKSKS